MFPLFPLFRTIRCCMTQHQEATAGVQNIERPMRKKIKSKELESLFQRRSRRLGWGVALAGIAVDHGAEAAVDVLATEFEAPRPALRAMLRDLLVTLCTIAEVA